MTSSLNVLASIARVPVHETNDDALMLLNNDTATLSFFGGVQHFRTLQVKGEQFGLGHQYFIGGLIFRSIQLLVTFRNEIKDMRVSVSKKGSVLERETMLKERANQVLKALANLWGEDSVSTSPFYEIAPNHLFQRVKRFSYNFPSGFRKGKLVSML